VSEHRLPTFEEFRVRVVELTLALDHRRGSWPPSPEEFLAVHGEALDAVINQALAETNADGTPRFIPPFAPDPPPSPEPPPPAEAPRPPTLDEVREQVDREIEAGALEFAAMARQHLVDVGVFDSPPPPMTVTVAGRDVRYTLQELVDHANAKTIEHDQVVTPTAADRPAAPEASAVAGEGGVGFLPGLKFGSEEGPYGRGVDPRRQPRAKK